MMNKTVSGADSEENPLFTKLGVEGEASAVAFRGYVGPTVQTVENIGRAEPQEDLVEVCQGRLRIQMRRLKSRLQSSCQSRCNTCQSRCQT
jgi:hypothetical protein